jgi:hypothetical protein
VLLRKASPLTFGQGSVEEWSLRCAVFTCPSRCDSTTCYHIPLNYSSYLLFPASSSNYQLALLCFALLASSHSTRERITLSLLQPFSLFVIHFVLFHNAQAGLHVYCCPNIVESSADSLLFLGTHGFCDLMSLVLAYVCWINLSCLLFP